MATARKSRLLTRTALGLGIVLVLFIAAAISIALANPSALANRIAQQEVPQLSKQLGRPVSVGKIDIGWFPVHAVVHDVRVGGAKGEPELLVAPSVTVRPRLWPLIRSRGRDVQIASVDIHSPTVNLVRLPDGSFDLPEGSSTPSADTRPSSRTVSVGRASLEKGTLRLFARGTRAPLVALQQIHLSARDIAIGAPLQLAFDAALGADSQNLHGKLSLDRLPANAAALRVHPPRVDGSVSLEGAELDRFRALMPESVKGMVQGGAFAFQATVSGAANLELSGSAKLAGLSLRGKPADASFDWTAQLSPTNPETAAVQLSGIKLEGPGVNLGGSATASLAQKQARFNFDGPLLDLDALLSALPKSPNAEPKSEGMSAQVRRELEQLDVSGTLKVQKVVVHQLEASDLDAVAQLRGGKLVFSRARASIYGGALDADQAQIDLSQPVPSWRLRANLSNVEMGELLQKTSGQKPFVGRASGTIALAGVGSAWSQLRQNLTGQGSLLLARAALQSGALAQQLAAPLRQVLPGAAGKTAAEAVAGTPMKNLGLGFAVRDGFLQLERPIAFDSDFGKVTLSGKIGLDGRLALAGNVAVAPGFIESLAGKGFAPKQPLEIPVRLGGTLEHPALQPSVSGPELASRIAAASGAGKALQGAQNAAKKAAKNAAKNLGDQARKNLGHLLGH